MARKKIVFVIVEGPSDDEALSLLLDKIFDKSKVFVHITHGDITSEPGEDPSTILARIGDIVAGYAASTHLSKVHFQEIIHIVDMDGAYISDDHILQDDSAAKPVYTLTEIKTNNVSGIKARNDSKRKCLNRISMARNVWGVPYQAYYMSCSLDHVLYDKQNSSDAEKERDSLSFAKAYRNDVDGFIKFIAESDFSVSDDYVASWNYIKQELHSLERHTNLGICLKSASQAQDAET